MLQVSVCNMCFVIFGQGHDVSVHEDVFKVCIKLYFNITALCQKALALDFSTWNTLADQDFRFYDSTLLEAVKAGEPTAHEFFRLLSLCHTVMSEEKSEGNCLQIQPWLFGNYLLIYLPFKLKLKNHIQAQMFERYTLF